MFLTNAAFTARDTFGNLKLENSSMHIAACLLKLMKM
jgi:hypothetical protein